MLVPFLLLVGFVIAATILAIEARIAWSDPAIRRALRRRASVLPSRPGELVRAELYSIAPPLPGDGTIDTSRRRSVEVDIDDLVDTLESVALDANGAARILDGARALTDPAAAAAQSPSSDPGFDARATAPRTKSTG